MSSPVGPSSRPAPSSREARASRGPVDPRLLRHARVARGGIAVVAVAEVASAVALLGQAFALADLVTALWRGAPAGRGLALLVAVSVVRVLSSWVATRWAQRTASRVRADLRERVVARALAMGPAWVESFGTARLSAVLTQGLPALDGWFTRYLPALVPGVLLPPVVLVALLALDVESAVTVAVTLPLVPVFAVLLGRATQARADRQWRAGRTVAAHFLDVVRGLPTLRAHRRAGRQVAAVAATTQAHRRATTSVLRLAFLSSTALDLVGTLSVGLVAVTAGMRLAGGSLDLRTALLVILLAPEGYRPLREVGARFHDSADAGAVVADVDAVLSARPVPVRGGAAPGLVLTGVGVDREDGTAVVSGLDLSVAPGELVALAGMSGAGKTTVARVAAGLRAADRGRVGHDPAGVAHLPQRPTFPHAGTVAEAVRAGSGASDGEVSWALAAAAAADLSPATVLGEGGAGLSAGQRQRVALARTFLAVRRGARRVVLDEPTAHLDPVAERIVVGGLRRLAHEEGCAVLVVAHRPALLAAVDRTVVLQRPTGVTAPVVTAPVVTAPVVQPPVVTAPVVAVRVPATGIPVPGGDVAPRRWWSRSGVAVGLGAAAVLAGVGLTAAATWLVVTAADRPPVLTLSVAAVLVRASAIARPLLAYAERLVGHDVAFAALARWRSDVVAALVPRLPGPLSRRRGGRSGDLLTQLVDDVDARVDASLRYRHPLAVAATALVVVLGAAWWVDPRLPAAALPGLLLAAVVAPLVAGRAERGQDAHREASGALASATVETLAGVEDLRGRRVGDPLQELRRRASALVGAERARARWAAATAALVAAGQGATVVGLALVALRPGTAGVAVVAAAVLAGVTAVEVTRGLPDVARARERARRAAGRSAALLAQAPTATEPERPVALAPVEGGLRLRGVVAGWDRDAPSLRGLDLDLRPGEVVAVRGRSGSGKSTLAAVLLRFLDVNSGEALLDGVRLDELAGDDVRSVVGLVGDDEHVFATSVRENLLLAAPGSSDADLRAVLERVRLTAWCAALPAGLDSRVGDGGAPTSGGERRRLAMARALLAGARVLVLDEPSEGLDEETGRTLLADLLAAGRDGDAARSVLLLAHREEGVDRADRVLDLVGGRLRTARVAVASG